MIEEIQIQGKSFLTAFRAVPHSERESFIQKMVAGVEQYTGLRYDLTDKTLSEINEQFLMPVMDCQLLWEQERETFILLISPAAPSNGPGAGL